MKPSSALEPLRARLETIQLFEGAFDPSKHRSPRSPEYWVGVLAALRFRIESIPIHCPYRPGTAQADAFNAGLDEGHAVWRSRGGHSFPEP